MKTALSGILALALLTAACASPSSSNPAAADTWKAMAAAPWHTLAIRSDGTLWAWGHHRYGQLGIGSLVRSRPVQVH